VRFTLFDVKFAAPLDWSASAETRQGIERRSGYVTLSLHGVERICCDKTGPYYPNWDSQAQVVSLLETTWYPTGAREDCNQTDLDRKITGCTRLIEHNPNDTIAYEHRANAYADKGQFDLAIVDARQLISLNPRDARYHDFSGRIHVAKGDHRAAIGDFNEAIALDPWNERYYEVRASSFTKLGEHAFAIADDEVVVYLAQERETGSKGRPGSDTARALGNLAWDALLGGSVERAREASERAVSLAPDILWLRTNLAHALLFSGRAPEAKDVYIAYKGERIPEKGKLWEEVIKDDFEELRRTTLGSTGGPAMTEVEDALGLSQTPQ
jgi:tetratricopeptide (TPR) repeat protein